MIRVTGNYKASDPSDSENLNEQVTLNEMATILDKSFGLGIEIVVHSNDHLPPHMHIIQVSDRKPIAKVLIPRREPKTADDIIPSEGYALTNGQKRQILKALLCIDKHNDNIPVWRGVRVAWNWLNPAIKMQ